MTYRCTIILFLPLFSCSSDLDATRRKTTMHCIQQAKKADHPWYLYKIWPIMDIKSHRSCSIYRDIWCWGTATHSFQLLVRMCTSLSDSKHHRSLFMIVHLWLNADVWTSMPGGWWSKNKMFWCSESGTFMEVVWVHKLSQVAIERVLVRWF